MEIIKSIRGLEPVTPPKGRPEQLDKKSCKQNHYGFAKVLEKEMEKYELSRHVDGLKKPVTAEEGPGDNHANE